MKRLAWVWVLGLAGCLQLTGLETYTFDRDEEKGGKGGSAGVSMGGASGTGVTGGTGGAVGGSGGEGGATGGSGGTGGSTGGSGGTGGSTGGSGGTGGSTGGEGGVTGGSGGMGGATGGAAGATGGEGGTGGCPTDCGALEECNNSGICVAKSVNLTGAGYSIDATEVTRSQYDVWLATKPLITGQPPFCQWNASFKPACDWQSATKGDHPAICVDFCDAYAYCQAVGKRLCGSINGGANGYNDHADMSKSQWAAACSSEGKYVYPYSDSYDGRACNGADKGEKTTLEVGTLSGCQSPASGFEGVYDMSGNVREWEDSCNGNTGKVDECHVRGGSFNTLSDYLRCTYPNPVSKSRNHQANDIGFRCCSFS